MLGARKNEVDTEEHMHKIAEREEGRLRHEIQKLEKELEELKEKRNIHEVRSANCVFPRVGKTTYNLNVEC